MRFVHRVLKTAFGGPLSEIHHAPIALDGTDVDIEDEVRARLCRNQTAHITSVFSEREVTVLLRLIDQARKSALPYRK